jgi:hypothetical protein
MKDSNVSRPSDIGWVVPATPIRGLDHLGVQGPCEALYAQLLPGITNVTDRARYYSFYPWLLRSFEQRYRDHSLDEFRLFLRRAECLFALIAIRHARIAGDQNDALHGLGMVGRLALLRIPPDLKSFELEDYAGLDAPHRYFQNKLGGLGQYYFGPLRDLRIIDYVSQGENSLPGYDKIRGSLLADAFGAAVPENAFFRVLESGRVRWTDLDGLSDFCPCALHKNKTERNVLLDLFFARSDTHKSPEASNRRASLALILDLLNRTSAIPGYSFENVFRAAAYTAYLPDQTKWDVPAPLAAAQRGWGTYQRNELFSLALQALFSATLARIEYRYRGRLRTAADAADVCAELLPRKGRDRLVVDTVSELKSSLPPIEAWQDERHEMQRGWRILETEIDNDTLPALLDHSTQVLLSLLARSADANPYREFDFDPDYFAARELHLVSFGSAWETTWANMTVEEWVRWLAVHWGIQRHLSVALRKLRGEQRDTFRIRPLEHELRVVEIPPPAATIPRLGKAFQVLRDLNLTRPDEDGWPHLTSAGRVVMEVPIA